MAVPCLSYPRPHDTCILDIDVSEVSIDEELSQILNGVEVIISYDRNIVM